MFKNLTEVKAANKAAGMHWFERGAMRFFNTKIHGGLRGGRYFITSDRPNASHPLKYSVRQVHSDGSIETLGFQKYDRFEDARDEIAKLSKHTVTRSNR